MQAPEFVLHPAARPERQREFYDRTVDAVRNALTRALLANSIEDRDFNSPAFQKLIQQSQKTLQEAIGSLSPAAQQIAEREWTVNEVINLGDDRSISILLERQGSEVSFRIIPFNVRLPYSDMFRLLESPPRNTPFDVDIDLPANRLLLQQLNRQLRAMDPKSRKSALSGFRYDARTGVTIHIVEINGKYVLRRMD